MMAVHVLYSEGSEETLNQKDLPEDPLCSGSTVYQFVAESADGYRTKQANAEDRAAERKPAVATIDADPNVGSEVGHRASGRARAS
jgi:hypothetical protein